MGIGSLVVLIPTALILFLSGRYSCSDEVSQVSVSPDRSYTASVSIRDCGGTSDFSTHIMVSCQLTGCTKTVSELLVLGGLVHLRIEWTSSKDILVTYDGPVRQIYNKYLEQSYFLLHLKERGQHECVS